MDAIQCDTAESLLLATKAAFVITRVTMTSGYKGLQHGSAKSMHHKPCMR